MAQLSVWTFADPAAARHAARHVQALAAQAGLSLHDGALLEWAPGDRSPETWQPEQLAGPDALGTTFWDMIFGIVFLGPLLADAADGWPVRLWDSLANAGIQDTFLEEVHERVVPGTSALWVLADEDLTRVLEEAWRAECGSPVVAVVDERRRRALHRVFPR